MQLKASATPPNLTRDLDARIERKKTESQSLQRHLHSTQDSLNCWDEVNLNSVQGVYVDVSVGTSTSSVSRITEPAITQPQAVCDPELFHLREQSMPKAAPKLAAAPSTPPASISRAPTTGPNTSISTTTFPIESTDSTVTVPDY